jgi:predicted O-methyltransferase YrrM
LTTREATGLLAQRDNLYRSTRERALVIAWAVIQWPWLLLSLHGGRLGDKQALLDRIGLPRDALPNLGSWKADTVLLRHIVDAIEELRPREVVELGCGASSLVIAQALSLHGGGHLTSFDQHAEFVAATAQWLDDHGLAASMHHAPLVADPSRWSGTWYELSQLPATIDLLVIDGPPWALGPFGRGRAEVLFDRITPGGLILLDDAARPGERLVARRWREDWPEFEFMYDGAGAKGTLIGRRRKAG